MKPEDILKEGISSAFKTLYQLEVAAASLSLQPTRKEFKGNLTLVTFPWTKPLAKSPEVLGQEIGEWLKANVAGVSGYNVVKGFLNVEIGDDQWLKVFNELIFPDTFGRAETKGDKVMVEYSSPNTNKPLHLGHLRNNFLGFSISQILKANGYDVVMANLVNDRGIHICKSMVAYQLFGNGETPASSGLKGDHLVGKYYVEFDKAYKKQIEELVAKGTDEETAKKEAPVMKQAQEMLLKWEEGDTATVQLWKTMNGWVYEGFDKTYKSIGVSFDKYYYESDTYLLGKEVVEEGLKKGVFFRKADQSVWVDLTAEGLDEKLLLRGDGTSVYITQDLGTADLKFKDFQINRSIYVVGNEQDYHFNVLKLILKKLGRTYADGVYHMSYGMVDLPSGRMKSREGTVVDADDLIQETKDAAERVTRELGKIEDFSGEEAQKLYHMLGVGALKYFLLKVDPKKRMLFNPEESVALHGFTAPFIQYTHARISALLRTAEQKGINWKDVSFEDLGDIHPNEKDLIIAMNDYPKRLQEAAMEYSPAVIAQFSFDLAKEYNRFYDKLSVFHEEDKKKQAFRLALNYAVARTIRQAMLLLGIEVPDRM